MLQTSRKLGLDIRVILAVFIALIAAAISGHAEEIDVETEIVNPTVSAQPGEVVTYTVAYTNRSTSDAEHARVRLILPNGVFLDWTPEEIEAVEDSISDFLGNAGEIRLDEESCDNILVSIMGSDGQPPLFPAGGTGQFTVDIPMADGIPTTGVFTVHSPPSVEGHYDFTLGECDDCGDLSSCFGGPLSRRTGVTTDLEVVNVAPPATEASNGCGELEGFTAGNIALVRRGGCSFVTKALNAQDAGASGVVIVNSNPTENIHSFSMGAGGAAEDVTVPVILVSYDDGEALIIELEAESQVTATLGGVETEDLFFASTAFHAPETDTDADGLNDSDTAVTNVDYILNEPPEASFTFAPPNPAWGQQIQFTDTSLNVPISWSWDFGDGVGTSDLQNPTYSYSEIGTHTVTLTVSNDFGTDDTSAPVSVGALIQNGHFYFVPAAAVAAGLQESFFVTDVEINNPGATTMTYQFAWLPREQDNLAPTLSPAFRLGPDGSARYPNILGDLFDLEEAFGAIGVVVDSEHALLISRTYNQPQGKAAGTFGQGVPGLADDDMTATGERQRILFMTENDVFRANVGCQNGVPKAVQVTMELFAADGTSLEVRALDLAPWGNRQVNRIFKDYQPIDVGFVDVWSNTPDALFTCYGSVLDNETSDPTTVLPQ
jgi:uncharacterized repeat protein (TIGR01451 family)